MVRDIIQQLSEAGFIVYVVGGCVRDFLLGKASKDQDLVTDALPDQIIEIFPNAITVGKQFGVIKIPTGSNPAIVEVATFRKDLDYIDYRHPSGVEFSGPEEDAQRRDFTINSLMFDPKSSRILDFTGGLTDLKTGVVRAIGEADKRFREDALRLMRAIRFSNRFGFQIERSTLLAIQQNATLVRKVSGERIRDEITAILRNPHPDLALKALSDYGLLHEILPEVQAVRAELKTQEYWDHLLRTFRYLCDEFPERSDVLNWMVLLHEIGRPITYHQSKETSFSGHELEAAKLVEIVARRLKFPISELEQIRSMVEDQIKFKDVFQMREATLERFVRKPYFEELLMFHRADARSTDGNLAAYEFCLQRFRAYQNMPPQKLAEILDGDDLIKLGLKPGPKFSEILHEVEDLIFEKKISTKDEAIDYVIKHFSK